MLKKNIIGCVFTIVCLLIFSNVRSQESFAESLANKQLEAYNNKDLEAFLDVFAEDVKIYDDLSKYNVTSRDQMQKNYEIWFDNVEYLECKIITRIAEGNTVVDFEEVTYQKVGEDRKTLKAIAIYRIKGNKISEVSFIRP